MNPEGKDDADQNAAAAEAVSVETKEQHTHNVRENILLSTAQSQIDGIRILRPTAISSNIVDTNFLRMLRMMLALLLHERSSKRGRLLLTRNLRSDNICIRVIIATHVRSVIDLSFLLAPALVHRPQPTNERTLYLTSIINTVVLSVRCSITEHYKTSAVPFIRG